MDHDISASIGAHSPMLHTNLLQLALDRSSTSAVLTIADPGDGSIGQPPNLAVRAADGSAQNANLAGQTLSVCSGAL
jgi:hypothetical protein